VGSNHEMDMNFSKYSQTTSYRCKTVSKKVELLTSILLFEAQLALIIDSMCFKSNCNLRLGWAHVIYY